MNESTILKQIQIVLSSVGARMFRNNCGVLKDDRGQYVRYGLCPGSSDLIGWKEITILPEMCGRKFAQFVAIEVKRPSAKPTKEQTNFINAVREAGGIANVCRSTSEALNTVS